MGTYVALKPEYKFDGALPDVQVSISIGTNADYNQRCRRLN